MKKWFLMSALLLPLCTIQPASADFVLKRLKCSEFSHTVYENKSAVTDFVTVQVVRDGCSPKTGGYLLHTSGITDFEMIRSGRSTRVYRVPVVSSGIMEIRYLYFSGKKRGTFDFKVDVD
jgi:hypothetical protein